MTVNAAIACSENIADILKNYLAKYAEESQEKPGFNVSRFMSGAEIATDYFPRYDIIFIEIPDGTQEGLSAARNIRRLDRDVLLIFVSDSARYAIEGYEVCAFGFLLKPLSYCDFAGQLKHAIKKIKKRDARYILLPTETGVRRQDISEIIYIETVERQLLFQTTEEKYECSKSLSEDEKEILREDFLCCSDGLCVNIAFINAVKGDKVYAGKYEFLIDKSRKKTFLNMLVSYFRSENILAVKNHPAIFI